MNFFKKDRNWGLTLLAVYLVFAGVDHFINFAFWPTEIGPAMMIAAGVLLLMGR